MRIKLNEPKILEFNMDTFGCSWEDLKGYLRFTFENVEYGFPAKFNDGKLVVEIPAFQNVINNKLSETLSRNKEVIVKGRLDIIANENNYLTPWIGDVEIEVPVGIRVKNDKVMKDIIEAAKDIKITDTKIKTTSNAEKNPQPFNVTLKKAKEEADLKARKNAKQEKKKQKSKLARMMMGEE
jgi:hypothetical protein